MFCPNCHMLKSNCVCGRYNKSIERNSIKTKSVKKVKYNSRSKVSIGNKKSNNEKNTRSVFSKTQEIILSEISNSIKEGYKCIVLEANYGNSDIAVKLANNFESSIILAANEKSQMKYNKKYKLRKNADIHLSNQKDFFKESPNIPKSKLLVIDDAHRLDENIVNLFSYTINLSNFDELIDKYRFDVKELPKKDYAFWIDFIRYLSLNDENIKRVRACIGRNPENWICSYDDSFHYDKLSFYPLNIGNLAYEHWFSKGEVCILMSPTILDVELFAVELGLDSSQIKFIHHDSQVKSDKNKIYARKTVNMQENNLELLFPTIEKILKKHENEKGLIIANYFSYSNMIVREIKNQRFLTYKNFDYFKKLKKFKESSNSVIVTDLLEDGIEFPYDECKFQIIVKQHSYPYNARSKHKQKESDWYSYKQVTNLMEQLQRPITSDEDYCATYILDERIIKSFTNDLAHNNFIPDHIMDSIVDLDMKDHGLVSSNIKKQFGVHYLFDYYKDEKDENEKIWGYKDYDKEFPNRHKEEFNYFTTKLMEAISELSNQIIDEKFNKLALVSVPSSTVERDNLATVKESINLIERWHDDGKTQSEFNCNKEIINCGGLLKRVSDVPTSHLSKERASYVQHMNSIESEKNDILEMEDAAFIILDDISTRGTILNACEDILINNGVKKQNIFKFALFKTQRR